jgi:AcrR family transcriptional regulator
MTTALKNLSDRSPNKKKTASSGRMKSDERRRQILDVSKSLFAEKGFNGTTTKEIATCANVNESLIFRHFAGKDALYEAVVADKCDEFCTSDYGRELSAAAEQNDDEKVFETAARIVLTRYQSKRDILRILIFGILENRPLITEKFESQIFPIRQFLAEYINKRQSDGVFFTGNAELVVFGFVGMVTHHTMLGELVSEQKKVASDAEAIGFFTRMILDCLRTK